MQVLGGVFEGLSRVTSHVGSGRWQVGGQPRGEETLSLSPRLSPANTMPCVRAFLYYYMSALASHSESVEHVHCAASGRVLQSASLLGRTGRCSLLTCCVCTCRQAHVCVLCDR